MTYLALLFTLTSNFLPMLQPVVAYAENETSVSEKIEQRPNVETVETVETVESRENEPLENSSEDSSASFDQSTDSSVELETDNIEIENENKMTKESTDQRSAKELASRIDPYDVQGLSDEEIISLAQYMYGDYVNSNPTAKIYVTNDKGNVIDIPFYQTYAVGSMELMPMNYSVSLGDTWLIKVSKIEKFRIDGKIAYCVQPGVPFNE